MILTRILIYHPKLNKKCAKRTLPHARDGFGKNASPQPLRLRVRDHQKH